MIAIVCHSIFVLLLHPSYDGAAPLISGQHCLTYKSIAAYTPSVESNTLSYLIQYTMALKKSLGRNSRYGIIIPL